MFWHIPQYLCCKCTGACLCMPPFLARLQQIGLQSALKKRFAISQLAKNTKGWWAKEKATGMNCNQQSKTWFPEFICLFFCCLVVFFALPLSFFLRCSTSCANRLRICAQKCMLWSMYFYQLVCIQQKKFSTRGACCVWNICHSIWPFFVISYLVFNFPEANAYIFFFLWKTVCYDFLIIIIFTILIAFLFNQKKCISQYVVIWIEYFFTSDD